MRPVHIAETERQEKVAVKTVLRSRVNFLQGQDRTKLRGDLAAAAAIRASRSAGSSSRLLCVRRTERNTGRSGRRYKLTSPRKGALFKRLKACQGFFR